MGKHHAMPGAKTASAALETPLLTAPEVAARLRVARSTVYEFSRKGELASIVLMRSHGRAIRRWQASDVDRFISTRRESTPDSGLQPYAVAP